MAAAVLVSAAVIGRVPFAPTAATASPPAGQNDTIVHLFEWNWPSVGNECAATLGPKGYGGVQVSPPQEHIVLPGSGYPWWQDYQPISYRLDTRRGDRAAFAAMVAKCNAAGVKVYVDAVLNHMQGAGQSGNGSAGSAFSSYNNPAVPYSSNDFHAACSINYSDANSVRQCQLSSLTDLKTETSYVEDKEAAYLNDLISLGVGGFRLDAAKHMLPSDIAAIQSRLTKSVYWYQEVTEGNGEPVTPSQYTGQGDVTDFRYEQTVGGAFNGNSLANLNNVASQMALPSDKALVFIDNHDTQRDGRATLTYKSGDKFFLAVGYMLAYPFGTPSVMSSYSFSSSNQSPPANGSGITSGTVCGSGWECEHRDRRIANMVALRNASRGQAVTNWWSNGGSAIGFGRGAVAYTAFNTSGSVTQTFQTSLPAGTYCNVMTGDFNSAAATCSGPTVTVGSNGTFSTTLGTNQDLAIYTGARVGSASPSPTPSPSTSSSPSNGTVATTFSVNATTTSGQNVYVVGSIPALGSWNTGSAVPLSAASYPVWNATVNVPANTSFAYKYIKKDAGGAVTWESTPDRLKTSPAGGSVTYNDVFNSTTGGTPSPTPSPSPTVAPSTVAATFAETATTTLGQNVYVVGSIPALGSWNTGAAIAMSSASYPTWTVTVTLPANTSFEYKYIKKDGAGTVIWESGANRTHTTTTSAVRYDDTWK